MSLLGTRLSLMIGPTIPIPVPRVVTDAMESVEVTQKDEGRSGFQITFRVGRGGPADLLDNPLLSQGLTKANMRVVITIVHNAVPRVLSDGIITHQQLKPGNGPGETRLVITGEDVSLAMDREEKNVEHPAQPELMIVAKICASYAQYGVVPAPIPPFLIDPPLVTERIPVQRGTDLQYLKRMAERFGYVFYIIPGPFPAMNIAYWGPPIRVGSPQPALTVNMGAATNVRDIQFTHDSQKAVRVSGNLQDRLLNTQIPIQSLVSTRLPLSGSPPQFSAIRKVLPPPHSGLSVQQALAYAQGIMDASSDSTIVAKGELDTTCYNGILEPRTLVGVRGAGKEYGGVYYVRAVTHRIEPGSYQQGFELTREGLGSLLSLLPL